MTIKTKRTGTASSIPAGILCAAFISIIITAALSAIIAYSINHEILTWEQSGYWIMATLLLSAFIGGKCAFGLVKRQRVMVAIMSGVLYWGILLCFTALFFGGDYNTIGETAGIIGAGCITSALIPAVNHRNQSHKTKRYIVKLNKNRL